MNFLNNLLGSSPHLAEWVVDGHVFGKYASVTTTADTRAILPLPSVLIVLDTALSRRWSRWIDLALPRIDGTHIGARPGTQSLQIAHALQIAIESGLDDANGATVGQSDVKGYFDALPILTIANWLVDHGALPADVAAIVRFQTSPQAKLRIGDGNSARIVGRSKGGLTGTRIAFVLARIPFEATIASVHQEIVPHGLPLGQGRFACVATYVDNFYVVAPSPAAVVHCLDTIESVLVDQWGLEIKPSSR